MLQLKVFKGPTQVGKVFKLEPGNTLIIGRATDADIRLKGPGVSKSHCQITVLPGSRVAIEDLGSANGTFVNGVLVKKYVLKAGDTISIHDFILQLSMLAPKALAVIPDRPNRNIRQAYNGNAAMNLDYANAPELQDAGEPSHPQMQAAYNEGFAAATPTPEEPLNFGEKMYRWLESNVFPWADRLSSQIDVRTLMVGFFLFWSILMVAFTAAPFMETANGRVRNQSIEVARLYARQLVRLNQQAIVDRRYQDLISNLDANAGSTPGLIQAMILDTEKAEILAPEGLLRQSLPDIHAKKALTMEKEYWEVDNEGIAYVSAPIWVGQAGDKDVVAATAYVVFNTQRAQFTLAAILDQAMSSLLYSLLVSFLFLLFVYRWTEGTLVQIGERVEDAMKNRETSIQAPVKWAAASDLCGQVSTALGRAGQNAGSGAADDFDVSGQDTDWCRAATEASGSAAAAFDANLKVLAWNEKMVRLIGIQASTAIGSEISDASRDIAFESAIRELTAEAQRQPWVVQVRDLEFAGAPNRISVVFGNGGFFVSIGAEG